MHIYTLGDQLLFKARSKGDAIISRRRQWAEHDLCAIKWVENERLLREEFTMTNKNQLSVGVASAVPPTKKRHPVWSSTN